MKKIRVVPKDLRLYVTHFRRVVYRDKPIMTDLVLSSDELLPRGGATLAELYTKDGHCVAEEWAHCSEKDNYCKKLGRNIAVGRVLKQFEKQASIN